MAHFAKLDDNNIVTKIIVVDNQVLLNKGVEVEQKGIDFCQKLFGGKWKQTSYNATFRKNYAGVGYYYDEARDAFIEPKRYESWTLDEQTCKWIPPIPYPEGKNCTWDEETLNWVELDF